jgi:hypothetical protein
MASMVRSTNGSEQAISMRTFSWNSNTTGIAAVLLDHVALPTVAADAGERHPRDPDLEECALDVGQLFGPDDRDDELHVRSKIPS